MSNDNATRQRTRGLRARRVFLAQAGASAVSIACAAGTARAECATGDTALDPQVITDAGTLAVDGILPFEYPAGHPCLLVRLRAPTEGGVGPDGDLVAFSAVCPHRGHELGPEQYKAEHGALGPCPWHNSAFDLKCGGAQIIGQANRHLPRITLEEREGEVVAVGIEGSPYALVRRAG
ncbi:MAG: Rieske 2Fe-2S domain-containing protein [Deltaproteobacteria bacterium]|nr:Rieske 2Fe-2S domain-containing protein [Deltaproteobacteria bacterium]